MPLPLASLCALRALQHLSVDRVVGRPDFIYLDASHEKGETLLEMSQGFALLRPGGVLVGDDLDWPAVEADLASFCAQERAWFVPPEEDEMLSKVEGLHAQTKHGHWVRPARERID